MAKTALLTGGTGFIGQKLCHTLNHRGYHLTVFSRQAPENVKTLCGRVETVSSLAELSGHPGFDLVINLAGEGIADKRWNARRKRLIRVSRVNLTEDLVNTINTWSRMPSALVSGSAVGFYGDQGERPVSEHTPPNDEFTHQLCRDWEAVAQQLSASGVRVCISRTGLVVGPAGGFLQRMLPPFRLGLGGKLGNGKQYMPWVHRDDVVNALIWMAETDTATGPYNVVSPNPVRNQEFTACLARVLKRPAVLPAPALALRAALGEMARLLLTGQNAVPQRLQEGSFEFSYPELEAALRDAIQP
ncbi:TIGR01777 family oxidoreductase [Marinobacter sp. SS21]|uniref:TIGR01777 family oxidoreductase n=1 Tax=Marinobacter sp. SS21 TaxID=2979460 RepID=UPI00232E6613|nr:TIGR01777 family oxidoreductase [Marinobacter sp. SS21]MDC0663312.1 TIGR01777 family oxidoreductase [Marinobacter sp. SS21]